MQPRERLPASLLRVEREAHDAGAKRVSRVRLVLVFVFVERPERLVHRVPRLFQGFLLHETQILLHEFRARLERLDAFDLSQRPGGPAVQIGQENAAAFFVAHVPFGIPRRKPIAHQREQRLRRGRSGLVPHHARAFVAFVFGVFVPIDQRVAQAHLARPAGFTIAFVVADAVGVILGEEILLEPVPALVQGCQARARGDAPGGPEEPAGSGRARRGESLERERRAATFARRRGGGRRRRR